MRLALLCISMLFLARLGWADGGTIQFQGDAGRCVPALFPDFSDRARAASYLCAVHDAVEKFYVAQLEAAIREPAQNRAIRPKPSRTATRSPRNCVTKQVAARGIEPRT